jgi:predicted DNA-binding transcriptional regulator AlpA
METITPKRLLTINDLAKILKCSRRTIFRLNVQQKTPPPLDINGLSMWPAKEIKRWVAIGCPSRKAWKVVKQLEEKLRAAKAKQSQKKKRVSQKRKKAIRFKSH